MGARAAIALVALLAVFAPISARPQPNATILIEVGGSGDLPQQLERTKADALLLYTEACSKTAADMKSFYRNVSSLAQETLDSAYWVLERSPSRCCSEFKAAVKKIEMDAQKAATFSTETHHKFLLGHMIVFRMHLNKSDEFIKRSERILRACGQRCETMSRVNRWRRLALCEINRVRKDIEYARKSYKDLILHALRKMNHLRIHAKNKLQAAVETLQTCSQIPYEYK